MRSTFSRTFLTFSAILLSALLVVGFSLQALVKNYLEDRTIEDLKSDSAAIAQLAAAYHQDMGMTSREFLTNLSVASSISGADAVLCNAEGKLLLCSDAPLGCEHQGLSITSREYLQAVRTQDFVINQGVISGLYDNARYVVSTCVKDPANSNIIGIVMVSTPIADTLSILERMTEIYLFVSILVVLAALIAVTLYTRKNTRPLKNMAATANAFGHGNLKARAKVPVDAPQEICDLALAFNNMAQSLEKSDNQRTEFVANVSHELKTPMTTIGGYVDGILDGTISQEQQRHYLQIVSDETKRLSRLVRSMLDISRLQDQAEIPEEKRSRFDLEECAGQVLITFEQQINRKELNVDVSMPEHAVYTFAGQDYITQVIYNLLDNAVKFCPQGGNLGLSIREGDHKIYVTVSNDGGTIPASELPLLFDRFHKLDKSRSQNRDGWGLGLYIVKTIICGHGEDISVSSADGITRFTFTLPLVN